MVSSTFWGFVHRVDLESLDGSEGQKCCTVPFQPRKDLGIANDLGAQATRTYRKNLVGRLQVSRGGKSHCGMIFLEPVGMKRKLTNESMS